MPNQTEIFTINLPSTDVEKLKETGFDIYEGSAGYLTNIKYGYSSVVHCLPNLNFPENLHEYQVGIVDLTNERSVPYVSEEHTRKNVKHSEQIYLTCSRPQDLFDPRPFSLYLFRENFDKNLRKGFLIVVFCSADTKVDYRLNTGTTLERGPYDFLYSTPRTNNIFGKRTKVAHGEGELFNFLKKYNSEFSYHVLFDNPEIYQHDKYVPTPGYTPLILSDDDQIAGISWHDEKSGVFYFPHLEDKGKFLKEFLSDVAPNLFPHLFPDLSKDKWAQEEEYQLPNQQRLFDEKKKLEQDFKAAIATKQMQIDENFLSFEFLTRMITTTGNDLVDSVVQFLKWIGYENAVNADLANKNKTKEEDINIELGTNLIIIEVKGIAGITSDNDCNQINKVKVRRIQERKGTKVFAHAIINHQRHTPALSRSNPPFSADQMQDAVYEKRGLMTTWQLFNVALAIENKIISKGQARTFFLKTGVLNFIPVDWVKLGTPIQFFPKITVIILVLDGAAILKNSDWLLFKIGDQFRAVQIESITLNREVVSETGTGEYGLKISERVPKDAILYSFAKTKVNKM